jgi:hypothetical protein
MERSASHRITELDIKRMIDTICREAQPRDAAAFRRSVESLAVAAAVHSADDLLAKIAQSTPASSSDIGPHHDHH